MKNGSDAILIYSDCERDADLLWATKMHVGDPFLYARIRGRSMMVMSDLEIGRARDQAEVDEIVSLSDLNRSIKESGIERPGAADHAFALLRRSKVRSATVPSTFPIALADALRKRGVKLSVKPAPFFEQRLIKTPTEVRAIEQCQRVNEAALGEALTVLKKSRISGKYLRYHGEVLTAEQLRGIIHQAHLKQGCIGQHTIVASGDQGCDPHNRGSGPVLANTSLILDIFPRNPETGYFSDMTRTVCRGKPSKELERLYETVLLGQEMGCRRIRAGILGSEVHNEIMDLFVSRGYKTGPRNGKMVGFFHGTGHGIGLDIHEPPRVSAVPERLKEGMVVTCEPGLYYFGIGGARIEDMVLVERTSARNLTKASKDFVI